MRRRLAQILVAVAAFALPLAGTVAPARADSAGVLLGLVNGLRAAHGVGSLAADPALTRAAQAWSAQMAAAGSLSHNPNLGSQVAGGWTKLGENVGAGGSVPVVFNAFVNSAFHFANMVDPTYNLTGIGVAVGANGTLWITEDFEAKPGATPAPVTTAAPTPAPVARPAAPKTTALPAAPAPTTAATAAPPTTAAPPPPATTTTSAPSTTTVVPPPVAGPESGLGDHSRASVGGAVAAAPATSRHPAGRSAGGAVLALTVLAIAALTGGAVFLTRRLRPR